MLRQRALSAVFIVIAAVVPAVLGDPVLTLAVIALAVTGIIEFCRAMRAVDARPMMILATVIGSLLILGVGFGAEPIVIAGIVVFGALSILAALVLRGEISGSTRDYALTVGAVVYVSVPLAHIPLVRNQGGGEAATWLQTINDWALTGHPASGLGWLVLIVAITWLTDTAAYLGGRSYGTRKLAPVLSPGKTVEGALSGVAAGAITGVLAVVLLGLPIPIYVGLAIGLLLSVVGQIGDLAESLIKRDLGIKDMGNVIPGHGGMLDRIDALLFTVPVGYYLILVALEVNWP